MCCAQSLRACVGAAHACSMHDRAPHMRAQRSPEEFGEADPYTWSEDKARQYAKPERETFGKFVKGKGFRLE